MTGHLKIYFAAAILASSSLLAQSTGSFVGRVIDPSGSAVPVCDVTATEVGTGQERHAVCNGEGYYVVPALRPTDYRISISAKGFGAFTRPLVTLQANQELTVDAHLEMVSVSQNVQVSTAPPQVDTTTPVLGQVIDQARIVELPLNGRNAAQLTLLVAGAVAAPDGRATQGLTTPVDVTISTNGARQNQISYQLDGANNTDELTNVNAPFPFPDALQEFSVQTSNYSAEFGQNSGAAVNIVTKSGANDYHGDVFGFLRNAVFNARNYFAATRDQLKRGQFGFTAGGPVRFPAYNGKDRTFFFVGYQGTRITNVSAAQSATVPLAANLNGDFSAQLAKGIVIRDPATGLPFPNNYINPSRFDPAALNVLKFLPSPSASGLVFYPNPLQQNYDDIVLRLDQKLSENDHLDFRYFSDDYEKPATFSGNDLLTLAPGRSIPTKNFLIHENHIFSSNFLNDFRFAFIRINAHNLIPAGAPSASSLGVKVNQDPAPASIGGITVSGFFSTGSAWPTLWVRNDFEWSDDLRWVKGRHDLAFGVRIERARFDNTNTYQQRPDFTFSGDETGYAISDFLLGRVRTFDQASGQFLNVRTTHIGAYIQDRIHISQRLTLSVGLRYEPFLPWHETNGRIEQFIPSAYTQGIHSTQFVNAPAGLFFPGDKGFPADGVNANYKDFAPRVGFAYDVFGDGKTSFRGGAGVFYDSRQVMAANIPFISNPFIYQVTITDLKGPFSNPYQGMTDPFPAAAGSSTSSFPSPTPAFTYDPSQSQYNTPVTYSWNLSMDHQLAANWLLRAAYVGSHSSHGFEVQNLNPSVYIPGSTLSTDQRRLYPGLGVVSDLTQDVNASYNSLQVTLTRRFAHGFTLLSNYTWSKNIDNLPVGASVNSAAVSTVLPWYYPNFHSMDRGPAEFDHTHVSVTSFVWQSPKVGFGNRMVKSVLEGWEISGIVSAQSGAAFTVIAGKDQSKTGLGTDRAVLSGTAYGNAACGKQAPCVSDLATSNFSLPAVGTFGTLGKGALRGPDLVNVDAGLFRTIPVTERVRIQIRAEFFNLLNHANFALPTASVSSGSFGQILSTATDPRIGQFGLKILF